MRSAQAGLGQARAGIGGMGQGKSQVATHKLRVSTWRSRGHNALPSVVLPQPWLWARSTLRLAKQAGRQAARPGSLWTVEAELPPLPPPPLSASLSQCALLLFMHLERCKLSASVTVCKSGIFNLNTTKQRQPTNSSTHIHTHTTHISHTPRTQSKLRAAQSKPSSAWSSINNIICLLINIIIIISSISISSSSAVCVCVCGVCVCVQHLSPIVEFIVDFSFVVVVFNFVALL